MCTIKEAKEQLKKGISTYMSKDISGAYKMPLISRIPFYLEGPPGIGKSEIVKQVSEELEIGYVGFSITHHTRNTVLGLPIIKEMELNNTKCSYSEFTISEIIARVWEQVQLGYTEGILMLDEFSCMSESLFPIMLAFLQTRNIGMYCLPEGWTIVLAGNPEKYNSSVRPLDFAIMDRIRKIEVNFSADTFLEYAREKKFNSDIIDFLELNEDCIYKVQKNKGQLSLVTSRGWENLSHFMNVASDESVIDENLVMQYVKDREIVRKFVYFLKNYNSFISKEVMETIIAGAPLAEKYYEQYKALNFDKKCGLIKKFVDFVERKGNCAELESEINYGKKFLTVRKRENKKCTESFQTLEAELTNRIAGGKTKESEKKILEKLQNYLYENGEMDMEGAEVLKLLEDWLQDRKNAKSESIRLQSIRISRMLQFMETTMDSSVMKMTFNRINNSSELMECLVAVENQEYIKLGQNFYEVEAC